MFEDVVGDEDVECAVSEGETGGVGLPDVFVDVAIEAGGDVGRGDGGAGGCGEGRGVGL